MSQPQNQNAAKTAADRAEAWIQLRVQARRKSAYVRAANRAGTTLTDWSLTHLDRASGYTAPTPAPTAKPETPTKKL